MTAYDSVELEMEKDRRVNRIAEQYDENAVLIFRAARQAGMSIGKHNTWFTAASFLAIQELKREIPAEYHPTWFGGRY